MGSFANSSRNGGGGGAIVDKGVDFAQYFCTYGFLYHQKEMLCDRVRMDAYFNAIFVNKHHFTGKVVLDVGTGSGILAIWSAQAGARKVYAVEATKMAEHARALVKANNLQDVVEVIEGPEKVDVIISEWMGYFLLRESMFDSVICARDRWLKPAGVMYPSHARIWVAPIRSGAGGHKMGDYQSTMDDWCDFLDETKTYYGVDMSVLSKPFSEEQKKYYLQFWCRFLRLESPIVGGDRFAMLISGRRKHACHVDFGFDLAFFFWLVLVQVLLVMLFGFAVNECLVSFGAGFAGHAIWVCLVSFGAGFAGHAVWVCGEIE